MVHFLNRNSCDRIPRNCSLHDPCVLGSVIGLYVERPKSNLPAHYQKRLESDLLVRCIVAFSINVNFDSWIPGPSVSGEPTPGCQRTQGPVASSFATLLLRIDVAVEFARNALRSASPGR